MISANQKSRQRYLSKRQLASLVSLFDRYLSQKFDWHQQPKAIPLMGQGRPKRRAGHNLLRLLCDMHERILLCYHESLLLSATNNMAERDIRSLKLQQKILGSFRTKTEALDFAISEVSLKRYGHVGNGNGRVDGAA